MPAPSRDTFSAQYPHIAEWVTGHGWVEIGYTDYPVGFVRALDIGGMVWEGKSEYASLEEALRDLDAGIAAWREQNG